MQPTDAMIEAGISAAEHAEPWPFVDKASVAAILQAGLDTLAAEGFAVVPVIKHTPATPEDIAWAEDGIDVETERLRAVLREFVALQDLKNRQGKTDEYKERIVLAWEAARTVLGQ